MCIKGCLILRKSTVRILVFGVSACAFFFGFKIVSKADSINGITKCEKGKSFSLKYDDRISIDSYYKGYQIAGVSDTKVNSYKVVNGKKTSTKDKTVVSPNNKSYIIASGIGSCNVYLAPKNKVSEVSKLFNKSYVNKLSKKNKEKYKNIKVYKVKVTVSAPKLTMMYLSGQSNMAGTCSGEYHPEDSVKCVAGSVYSTYASINEKTARYYTGIKNMEQITTDNMDTIVPSSLTSDTSVKGNKMLYTLDMLSSYAKGKAGMDGGLCYEWRRLTGDKVWAVNASWGNTSINDWTIGGNCYERALRLYKKTKEVCRQEIKAGHYKAGNDLMFFLQGEKDLHMPANEYNQKFMAMYNGFINNNICDHLGVVSVRAHAVNDENNIKDIAMTGPRVAQYLDGLNTQLDKLYMVSNINEMWTSDENVAKYFKSKYRSGKYTYPLRPNTTLTSVATKMEQIHPDVHYSQAGHNENAINAASNMYKIVYKKKNNNVSAHFVGENGQKVTAMAMNANSEKLLVPIVDTFESSKNVSYRMSDSSLTYNSYTGMLRANDKLGRFAMSIINNSTKKEIARCEIVVNCDSPVTLTGIKEENNAITLTWNQFANVNNYRIYRKENVNGKWAMIAQGRGTSFIDTNYEKGKTYYYTVRGIDDMGKSLVTGFDKNGLMVQTQNGDANNNQNNGQQNNGQQDNTNNGQQGNTNNGEHIMDNHFEQNAQADYNKYNKPSYNNDTTMTQ